MGEDSRMADLSLIRGGRASVHSFERLVRPHYDTLFRVALRLTASRQDAEDLVQETCTRAFRHIERLERLDNPRSWLLCILRRLFIDQTRRYDRSHVAAIEDGGYEGFASADAGPAELTDSDRIRGQLEQGLRRLSSEHRMLLLLHDVEGYSIRELETIMELKGGTIKSRLHRARVKLGRWLESSGCIDVSVAARSPKS